MVLRTVFNGLAVRSDRQKAASLDMRLTCKHCKKETIISKEESARLLTLLDINFPSQRVTVECSCGRYQFILAAEEKNVR